MPEYTPEQLVDVFSEAARTRFRDALLNGSKRLALFAEAEGRKNATERLRVRSGNLRRSITGSVAAQSDGASVELTAGGRTGGKDVPYAATQEFGATITPVRRQWLALPAQDVQTGAGVSRYASPRDYPTPLVFVLINARRAILLDPADGRTKWSLRKEVTIKPKWYIRDAMTTTASQVPDVMSSALSVSVEVGT